MKHRKHEESSMELLYEEVIQEILLRLPLKSLGKCKLVSKSWHSLISKPEFAKAHLQFSNRIGNPPLFLALQKCNIISTLKFDSSNDMISQSNVCLTPLDRQFDPCLYDRDYCFLIGSCDGLVCLFLKSRRESVDLMYLWNPTIHKHKHIPLPVVQGLTYIRFNSCWFGFVSSLNIYKIFLVYRVNKVERKYVCSLRDHEWREMDETNEVGEKRSNYCPFMVSGSKSVVMNEALHFIIGCECIYRFDLVAETYERIPLSIKPEALPKSCRILLGAIGEAKGLCAMVLSEEGMFDLWVLEEYNKWDSWTNLYKIDLQTRLSKNEAHFFRCTKSGYLCSEGEKGLELIDPSHNPPLCVIANKKCPLEVFQFTDHEESLLSPLSLP